jgi:hypothetical protein
VIDGGLSVYNGGEIDDNGGLIFGVYNVGMQRVTVSNGSISVINGWIWVNDQSWA